MAGFQHRHHLAHILDGSRPRFRYRRINRGGHGGIIHLLRQEAFNHGDFDFFLGRQFGAIALAVQFHTLSPGFRHAAQHGNHLVIGHARVLRRLARGDIGILQLGHDHADGGGCGRILGQHRGLQGIGETGAEFHGAFLQSTARL